MGSRAYKCRRWQEDYLDHTNTVCCKMFMKPLSQSKTMLSTIIRHYNSYGIVALLVGYMIASLILLGPPLGVGFALGWILQTNQGWPVILGVALFIFWSLPRIPILIMILLLIYEWIFNITRLNRLMDFSDYPLRDSLENWSSRSSNIKTNANTGTGTGTDK
jgi:hypothetical protein